jgi:uncharacterized protein YyaL (SSP411 family)
MANRLINSTSPYLLQHAHNPVDWFEWGAEALDKARQEDKPILVSIGYSSCHWCHVMERESFEIEKIADVMNKFFVCIKVDREERPDIDQIYMEAVQILGVNGGWPLNVFLTPHQKPFFGGTYFTPQVWVEVLNNIHNAFIGNRKQVEDTAEELRFHLTNSEVDRFKQKPVNTELLSDLQEIAEKLQSKFDLKWGGMDREPKFVMPSIWLLLLRIYHLTKNETLLQHVILTLKRISMGGIYDQIGGGFSRYSVDRYWFAPHFEKMLYDNAQLVSLYAEAYAITKDESFKKVVYQTVDWLSREMTSTAGGFYSALDADSEGVEGKFYVWTKSELVQKLGKHEPLIAAYYGVKDAGNWEHGNNILMRNKEDKQFLIDHQLHEDDLTKILEHAHHTLLPEREKRIRPGLDDKIITAWNAMMITGLIDAYNIFSDKIFLTSAVRNMEFLERELADGNKLFRSYKDKRSVTPAFLDDYAYFIQALVKLYQATFDETWIKRAHDLLEYVIEHFFDVSDGYFFYTSSASEELISRKKEIFDNVIPASNSVMAQNVHYLSILFDRADWKKIVENMIEPLSHVIRSEPGYMSQWGIVHAEIKKGMAEIAIIGKDAKPLRSDLLKHYVPFTLIQGTETVSDLPLLKGKSIAGEKTTIFVCFDKTCKLPVHKVDDALQQLI